MSSENVPNYTLVVGVDRKHLDQLKITLPTWKRNKPSILDRPVLAFYDHEQVKPEEVQEVIDGPRLKVMPWPYPGVTYKGKPGNKWTDPQRHAMLAGFVHVPTRVDTPYWLKLDTDTVAAGDDDWIDESWFDDEPAIVAHRWSFTKPPDQMLKLDEWVKRHRHKLRPMSEREPLNLSPRPGAGRLGHKRIISWAGFFDTKFTAACSKWARITCGWGKLPVASQDSFIWYCAKRTGLPIRRVNMKGEDGGGFVHRSSMRGIEQAAREVMKDG